MQVLVVNPGSTTTKLAIYSPSGPLIEKTITHKTKMLTAFPDVTLQLAARLDDVSSAMKESGMRLDLISAVVARGGLVGPVEPGIYPVNARMLKDLRAQVQGPHASNLGGLIADAIAGEIGIPAYVVDPVSCDQFHPLARLSGLPEIPRKSLSHALNIRATMRLASMELGCDAERVNYVVAHLGGGISVAAVERGRIIDANNANEQGPFSPERTGELPAKDVAELAFSGDFTKDELIGKFLTKGGLVAYLGTSRAQEIERRIAAGDEYARLVYEGMAYQISKEIGAMASVLSGKVKAILVCGGLAGSDLLVSMILERVSFIAEIRVYPGEKEMEALAEGAYRALLGEEEVKTYV
ncbi:MAG: butyrate kinase [Firmicutes bacterium]|jgi:butyrate kinase|nr:butyrate kinase [Bacillota bacterium]